MNLTAQRLENETNNFISCSNNGSYYPYLAIVASNNNSSVHVGMSTNGPVLMTQQLYTSKRTLQVAWLFNSCLDIPGTGRNKQGVGVRNVCEAPDK